jgi:lipid-binding SYLF domain-containing protein
MRKSAMHKRIAVIILCLFLAPFIFTTNAMAATAQEIDARVDATLKIFRAQVPGADQYLSVAKGVLVFPSVFRAGVGIGGEYGEGAMRINGKTVEYWSTASASIGFTFGAQSKSLILVFLDEAELIKFRNSEGWRAGIDGSVAFVEWGKAENVDTINTKDPILGFAFGNKGLMANIALEGSKFILLNKE